MRKTKNYISKDRRTRANKSRLPVFLTLGGGVILALAVFLAFQAKADSFFPGVTGRPGLKTDKAKVDLGNVRLGNPVQVSFRVSNEGDQPLKFTKPPYVEVVEGC